MRSVLAITVVMSFTNLSLAQQDSLTSNTKNKYAIGIGIGDWGNHTPLVSFNFRKYNETYNLKAMLFFGPSTTYRTYDDNLMFPLEYPDLPIQLSSPDSNNNFIGKEIHTTRKESLMGVKFGIEKQFKLKLVNFIGGVDVLLDYYKTSATTRANNYLKTYQYNEFDYLNHFHVHYEAEEISRVNELVTTSHFLHYGIGVNLGLQLNITKNIFITTMVSFNAFDGQHLKTTNSSENDNYIDQLYIGNSDIKSNIRTNVALNYVF